VVGIALDEGGSSLATEDAHILLVAHHAFEQRRTLLHLLDVVEIVHQVAEVLHTPDERLVGALRQGLAGGAVEIEAQSGHHQAGHEGEQGSDAGGQGPVASSRGGALHGTSENM